MKLWNLPREAVRCATEAVAAVAAADERSGVDEGSGVAATNPLTGALGLWLAHLRVLAARTMLFFLKFQGGQIVAPPLRLPSSLPSSSSSSSLGSRCSGDEVIDLREQAMLYMEEALPVIEVALGAEHHATARARQLLSVLDVHATANRKRAGCESGKAIECKKKESTNTSPV